MYLPGRCASVIIHDSSSGLESVVGHFGILHPIILRNYEIQHALIAAVHIDVAPLFQ